MRIARSKALAFRQYQRLINSLSLNPPTIALSPAEKARLQEAGRAIAAQFLSESDLPKPSS